MEVLITHGWSEQNTGDYAIESSIMKVIDDASQEDVNFSIYSLFDKKDHRLLEHNTLKLQKENVKMIPSLWATPPIQYNKFLKVLYIFKSMMSFMLIRFFLFFNILIDKRLHQFKNADLVVVKGGTFIYTIPGLRGIIFGLRILFPIILASHFKKKTIIAPHSFGPFNNKWMDQMIFKYLRKLDYVYCRENESVDFLKKQGVENCTFLPDMAFYNDGYEKKEPSEKIKVGITARPLDFLQKDKNQTYKNYIQSLVDYIEQSCGEHKNMEFYLIPQVIGPDEREDDFLSLQEIWEGLSREAQEHTKILERKLREPNELIKIYAELDILIGTRMHSVIFGLLSGVKPIAVSYLGPKHTGIMNSFGLKEFVTDIRTIQAQYLVDKTNVLLQKELTEDIKRNSRNFKKLIFQEFDHKLA